jgi:hypothetical protein
MSIQCEKEQIMSTIGRFAVRFVAISIVLFVAEEIIAQGVADGIKRAK